MSSYCSIYWYVTKFQLFLILQTESYNKTIWPHQPKPTLFALCQYICNIWKSGWIVQYKWQQCWNSMTTKFCPHKFTVPADPFSFIILITNTLLVVFIPQADWYIKVILHVSTNSYQKYQDYNLVRQTRVSST